MADSSLDDFFAKKDKNKRAKKKFTTTEQIAKKLEESGKKTTEPMMASKPEKEKTPIQIGTQPVSTITQAQVNLPGEDDEWRDFEEEKEKDYSGLKIHNLQIIETKDEEFEREKIFEDEDGEPVKKQDGTSGPWNKITGMPMPEQPPTPPPVVEVEPREEAPKSGVYRPPHARSTTSSSHSASKSRQSNKTAPELSSELHFPSLSAAADNVKGSKKGGFDSERGFESVKRGSKTTEDVGNKGPKLDLGNKFNALSQSDMS